MYNSMLEKVTKVIKETSKTVKVNGEQDQMYNYLFNPNEYLHTQRRIQKREEVVQKIVAGVTILAASGEAYHLVKRSGIINKLSKRFK